MKIVPQVFFEQDTLSAARSLVGMFLVRERDGKIERHLITEVEAYVGPEDLACHAAKGKTPRTSVMFGPAGFFYIYFVYGMHWMLNVVTEKEGFPAAILIRGLESVSGPGRLTKTLRITGTLSRKSATKETGLWFEAGNERIEETEVIATRRIGVDYAGPIWSKKPYRFVLKKSTAAKKKPSVG